MNAVKVKGMDPKYTWKIIVIYKAPNEDMMIQRVIEGKIKGGIEVTRRRGRRRRKLLDDLNPLNAELNPICYLLALLAYHFLHVSRIRVKERRGYCHLKEEALDRTMWRARYGRGFGPVLRHY